MLKRESEIYHNKGDSYGISLLSYKSGKSQRKQDQNSPSCSTQTKRTWSEWRPGAQSQATDKNVQFISSKNYFLLMKAAACIRHGCIKVFMRCDAIILWTNFTGGNSKAKEAHCACKGRTRQLQWFLFGQKRIQWMSSFVGNGRPDQPTRIKADFYNSRKKQKQGCLIWSKMR